MRHKHDVRQLAELEWDERFALKDIETCGKEMARAQRAYQRLFVDHRPARSIDHDGLVGKQGEPPSAQPMASLGSERDMEREHLGLPEFCRNARLRIPSGNG